MEEGKTTTLRLNKAVSDTGHCSRREADRLIEQGRVTVNGLTGVLGQKVSEEDVLAVDGKQISVTESPVYIAFNKPVGIISTTEKTIQNNIIDYIGHPRRIFPIGRLDKPSEGLILLTSDGNIVNKILRAGNNHEKEYLVTVNKPITNTFINEMSNGIPILDTVTDKCIVTKESNYEFRIILKQGLNRQIRRMCGYLNYEVEKLRRIRIMNILLDGIEPGRWRDLTKQELSQIMELTANSIKTADATIREMDEDDME
jgi:23S rRNA pseudouridine2604 synthase